MDKSIIDSLFEAQPVKVIEKNNATNTNVP